MRMLLLLLLLHARVNVGGGYVVYVVYVGCTVYIQCIHRDFIPMVYTTPCHAMSPILPMTYKPRCLTAAATPTSAFTHPRAFFVFT